MRTTGYGSSLIETDQFCLSRLMREDMVIKSLDIIRMSMSADLITQGVHGQPKNFVESRSTTYMSFGGDVFTKETGY
jgi:hypothetical protein